MPVGWEASRARCGTTGGSKIQASQEGRRVADLVLVTGQRAPRQAAISSCGGRRSQTIVGSLASRRAVVAQEEAPLVPR